MKALKHVELIGPSSLYSFEIIEEANGAYLKVFLISSETLGYERLKISLLKDYGINGQIDSTSRMGLVFKGADMAVIMAINMLKNNWARANDYFHFLDLAIFIVKSHKFINDVKLKAIIKDLQDLLTTRFDLELSKYDLMNDVAVSVEIERLPHALPLKYKKNSLESIHALLKNIIKLLHSSTDLYRKIYEKVLSRISLCNEISYRASVAVEALQKINHQYSREMLSLFNSCFKSEFNVFAKMHGLASVDLAVYLQKFIFTDSLLPDQKKINSEVRAIRFFNDPPLVKKRDTDHFYYKSTDIAKINLWDINGLQEKIFQLNTVQQAAELILNNYDIFRSYTQKFPCVISNLLPESHSLLSPLFHQYNSCASPLIAAISDHELNQAENLQLFSDLAKTKPYGCNKLNISIYDEGRSRRSDEFMSPLCHAVEYAIPEVVRILLENNATVNPVDNRKTPLHRAMLRGELAIVKLLLHFGARPNMVTDDEWLTPLHHARNAECARFLIDTVAEQSANNPNINLSAIINAQDRSGNTPLLTVAKRQVIYADSPSSGLEKALLHAQKRLGLIQMYVDNNADLNVVNKYGHTALHYLLMLECQDRFTKVYLPSAMESVKTLVEAGANVNIVSKDAIKGLYESSKHQPFPLMTPLLALYDNYYIQSKATKRDKTEQVYIQQIAEMLVRHGANIDVFDGRLQTPLSKAILVGADITVEFLLTKGANPNLRFNKSQPTPLHLCMGSTNNRKSATSEITCLEYLFNAGANPKLLIHKTAEIKIDYLNNKSKFSVNSYTMRLILSQENEFSRQAMVLDMTDIHEPIEERFLRIWTAMHVNNLKICVQMNPLDYSHYITTTSRGPHPLAVTLFNNWLDFYRSQDVRAMLTILCLSPLWVHIPKYITIFFVKHIIDNPMQIKHLNEWILNGRKSVKSLNVKKESLTRSIQRSVRLFSQVNTVQHYQDINVQDCVDENKL